MIGRRPARGCRWLRAARSHHGLREIGARVQPGEIRAGPVRTDTLVSGNRRGTEQQEGLTPKLRRPAMNRAGDETQGNAHLPRQVQHESHRPMRPSHRHPLTPWPEAPLISIQTGALMHVSGLHSDRAHEGRDARASG